MKIRSIIFSLVSSFFIACGPSETGAVNDSNTAINKTNEDTLIETDQNVHDTGYIVWAEETSQDFDSEFPLGKFKEYTPDGKLIREGEQVEFNACGMRGGVWKSYDENETLYLQIVYHLYNGEEETCHDTQIDMDITEYYPNGKVKATKYIHSCYECVQFKTGTWTYYNIGGEVDSTANYNMVELTDAEVYY